MALLWLLKAPSPKRMWSLFMAFSHQIPGADEIYVCIGVKARALGWVRNPQMFTGGGISGVNPPKKLVFDPP